MSRFASFLLHRIDYPEKIRPEKAADFLLTPARYLFRGKSIQMVQGHIFSEKIDFPQRTWLKIALMILCLVPGLLLGLPLKALCYVRTPAYVRNFMYPLPLMHEYERAFSPLIFTPYRRQMQASILAEAAKMAGFSSHLKTATDPFLIQIRELLKTTEEKMGDNSADNRLWHERWLKLLRQLLETKKALPPMRDVRTQQALDLIDRICLWMYTEPKLIDSYQQLLDKMGKLQTFLQMPPERISSALESMWKELKSNPALNKYTKNETSIQDPHLRGNLPTTQFRIGNAQFIYTARVSQENSRTGAVSICPEFLQYLEALERLNQTHLYINLQNRTKGTERAISLKIEELEQKRKAIRVVTLDNNSAFYKQEGRFEKEEEASRFKKAFLDHLFVKEGCYHWPQHLNLLDWQRQCNQILERVHAEQFQTRAHLSHSERRAFIDLAYVAMIRMLAKDVSFANITCKHSMDRGPTLTTLLFADELRHSNKPVAPEALNKLFSLFFVPPILTHNRPSLERLVHRISNALSYLFKPMAPLARA